MALECKKEHVYHYPSPTPTVTLNMLTEVCTLGVVSLCLCVVLIVQFVLEVIGLQLIGDVGIVLLNPLILTGLQACRTYCTLLSTLMWNCFDFTWGKYRWWYFLACVWMCERLTEASNNNNTLLLINERLSLLCLGIALLAVVLPAIILFMCIKHVHVLY